MGCRFPGCAAPFSAKGYCELHYRWLSKGWFNPETHALTDKWKGRIHYDKCKVDKCYEDENLRRGFCSKHYKRFRLGLVSEEGKVLKPPRKKYRFDAVCKVSGCGGKPRRWGFCQKHSGAYLQGRLNDKGEAHPQYERKRRTYSRDWTCTHCGIKGAQRYILGFCRKCHTLYDRKIIDYEGRKKRDLKRVPKYPEGAFCKIPGCSRAPRIRWMCENHALQVQRGTLTEKGEKLLILSQNKGKNCLVCNKEARIKGYCDLHYHRWRASGVAYLDSRDNPNWKNVGKKCSVDTCQGEARSLGMCGKHYYRHKQKISQNIGQRG